MSKTSPTPTITTIDHHEPTPPPPPPPSPPLPLSRPKRVGPATSPMHKTLASAANLANLLPTGTVLAFQTLAPSFSNKGFCQISNKCLTTSLVVFCTAICFLTSFTDSFTDSSGKLYYGIATFKGIYIFNSEENRNNNTNPEDILMEEDYINGVDMDLSKFRITSIDFVHAFVSLFVFLTFAFCDSNVQSCFFPMGGADLDALVVNLPLAAGVFSSFFFMIFPTTRRGIGYADMPPKSK